MPLTCIIELRQTILEKVKSSIHAINISVSLHQSLDGLSVVLKRIPEDIARLRAQPDAARIITYFGLRTPAGNVDTSYSDDISALFSFVDDGIYFPMLLCEVLTSHGQNLAKEFGKNPPKVKAITYKAFEDPDLLPDRSYYADFEQTYRLAHSPETPLTLRKRIAKRWRTIRLW
jgi:hypothetical protein